MRNVNATNVRNNIFVIERNSSSIPCVIDLKLGLLGVTVVYASGDYGVAGNGGNCLDGGVRVSALFFSLSIYCPVPLLTTRPHSSTRALIECGQLRDIIPNNFLSSQVVPISMPVYHQYRCYSGKKTLLP